MIRKFIRILTWFAFNFALPSFLFIVGINFFLDGAGIKFHVDHNSFTYLGLWIFRAGLPVTPASEMPNFKMLPLRRIEADDPLMKEIEKALREQEEQDRVDQVHRDIGDQTGWNEEDKKDDDSSGPSDPGSK